MATASSVSLIFAPTRDFAEVNEPRSCLIVTPSPKSDEAAVTPDRVSRRNEMNASSALSSPLTLLSLTSPVGLEGGGGESERVPEPLYMPLARITVPSLRS